jgi:ankyrin repeat protein
VLIALALPIAPTVGSILKYNFVLYTPIVQAARYQDGELVKRLLERGADPNLRGQDGLNETALHYMAAGGETDVVELLLRKGADPNARANLMHSLPLHGAVASGAPRSTIELLLQHGADPKLKDYKGRTAIELAAYVPEPDGPWLRSTLSRVGVDTLPKDSAESVFPP